MTTSRSAGAAPADRRAPAGGRPLGDLDDVRAFYENVNEDRRLRNASGTLEFERMKSLVLRHLPPAPATIADIGGGPGAYTLWLAGLGYRVEHRDLMSSHVEQVRAAAGDSVTGDSITGDSITGDSVSSAVADARHLDLDDSSVDAVLLLGPIYHLARRSDRLQALGEARRIARPGAPLCISAVSRWSMRVHFMLHFKVYEYFTTDELATEWVEHAERTGQILPRSRGTFTGYGHRPRQFRSEVRAAGLEILDMVSVDGAGFLLGDIRQRVNDPEQMQVLLETLTALERAPELLGLTHQMLIVARRPAGRLGI
jgi:SAM-dependent methyltransferase